MVFSLGKIFLSDREIHAIPFILHNTSGCAKIEINVVTLPYKLQHLRPKQPIY